MMLIIHVAYSSTKTNFQKGWQNIEILSILLRNTCEDIVNCPCGSFNRKYIGRVNNCKSYVRQKLFSVSLGQASVSRLAL